MASATMKHHRHVLSETTAILNSKPLHFITFSLLFLPLTITTISIIQSSADVTIKTLTSSAYVTFKTLMKLIPIILSTFTATSLITYTTLQITINPKTTSLTLISTLKSLFKPLLSTILTETIHLLYISVTFTHIAFSLTEYIKSFAFRFDVILVSFAFGLCVLLVIYWCFKAILGFEFSPFSYWLCSFLILLYAVFMVGLLLWCGAIVFDLRPVSKWLLVVQVCPNYVYCSMIVTQFVVANTVLYVRCKVASGELAAKSAVDDERVGSGFFVTTAFLQYVCICIGYIRLAMRAVKVVST